MAGSQFQEEYEGLLSTLGRFGRFRKRWEVLDGLGKLVIAAPGGLLVWFFLDWVFKLPAWPLLLLFVAVCGFSAWAFVRWLVKPQMHRIRIEDEALVVERLHGKLDNRLIGSLQLGGDLMATSGAEAEGRPLGYSAALVKELVVRTTEGLARIDTMSLVDLTRPQRFLMGAGGVAVVFILIVTFARGAVDERGRRLWDAYLTMLDAIFPVTMEVEPGDKAVVRGRPLALRVKVIGARRREVELFRTDSDTGETSTDPLTLAGEEATFVIQEADLPFTYKFKYGRRYSSEHEILVADLPEVKAINYERTPPPYTGQPMSLITGRIKKLQGLTGTAVLVSFAANTRLHPEMCYVEWMGGEKQGIDISGRFGSFAFSIDRSDRAAIHLTGHFGEGFEMERPLTFEVAVQIDRPPSIQLTRRLQGNDMSPGAANALRLGWFAKDDFGVQEVGLNYRVESVIDVLVEVRGLGKREGSKQQVIDPPRDRVRGRFQGIFRGMQPPLSPGDRVRMWLKARDNNTETGPGTARSSTVEFLLVGASLGGFALESVGDLLSARERARLVLGFAERYSRSTNLLQAPVKTIRTQPPQKIRRHELIASGSQGMTSGTLMDLVSLYYEALSGAGTDYETLQPEKVNKRKEGKR